MLWPSWLVKLQFKCQFKILSGLCAHFCRDYLYIVWSFSVWSSLLLKICQPLPFHDPILGSDLDVNEKFCIELVVFQAWCCLNCLLYTLRFPLLSFYKWIHPILGSTLNYNTSARHERHEWDTSNTSAAQAKNFDFDNDTGKNMFSHPYIYYMASERLQGEEQFHSKNYLLEMSRFHAKMRLKSAPQKLNFLIVKAISKSCTLDCSCKWPCTFLHGSTQEGSLIFEFCMETRLSNIFKTTNVTNLAKVVQKSSYRLLNVTSK